MLVQSTLTKSEIVLFILGGEGGNVMEVNANINFNWLCQCKAT